MTQKHKAEVNRIKREGLAEIERVEQQLLHKYEGRMQDLKERMHQD